jgi:hypothetical protein
MYQKSHNKMWDFFCRLIKVPYLCIHKQINNYNMKKIMMVAIALIASVSVFAQELKFSDLTTELSTKQFESYVSKDGTEFKVGGKVKMGLPSAQTSFAYVQHIDPLAGVSVLGANYANREVEIKKIQVVGNLKKGYKVWVITNGGIALAKLYFDVEPAIQTKEIKGDGMSSDEALSQLKKAKDKLDLGLITQEEFSKLRTELSKYIQ